MSQLLEKPAANASDDVIKLRESLEELQIKVKELEAEVKAYEGEDADSRAALNLIREATEGLLPTFSRLRDDPLLFAQDVRELLQRVPA